MLGADVFQTPPGQGGQMRKFTGSLDVSDQEISDDGEFVHEECQFVHIAEVAVEFFEKYYSLTLTFPDGSFRRYWLSQNTRVPKQRKAR